MNMAMGVVRKKNYNKWRWPNFWNGIQGHFLVQWSTYLSMACYYLWIKN